MNTLSVFDESAPAKDAQDLRTLALQALRCSDPATKVALAIALHNHALPLDATTPLNATVDRPGSPVGLTLMTPLQVKKRSPFTAEGLAHLAHAVTHIEFNAINLALDAIWRFAGMPKAYYRDWARVAAEEAHHFSLLRTQLQTMGHDYGDFPAHTGLWDMKHKTRDDVLARMALVPRTLEARGLDATPPMQARLRKVATPDALRLVAILDVILRDEVGHVAIGNHWYRHLCTQRGLEPVAHYAVLARQYEAPRIRGPLNLEARRSAGFDEAELRLLEAQS